MYHDSSAFRDAFDPAITDKESYRAPIKQVVLAKHGFAATISDVRSNQNGGDEAVMTIKDNANTITCNFKMRAEFKVCPRFPAQWWTMDIQSLWNYCKSCSNKFVEINTAFTPLTDKARCASGDVSLYCNSLNKMDHPYHPGICNRRCLLQSGKYHQQCCPET